MCFFKNKIDNRRKQRVEHYLHKEAAAEDSWEVAVGEEDVCNDRGQNSLEQSDKEHEQTGENNWVEKHFILDGSSQESYDCLYKRIEPRE